MNSRLSFDFSQTIVFLGFLSKVQSKQQTPVGPAPIIKTVSSSVIFRYSRGPESSKGCRQQRRLLIAYRIRNLVPSQFASIRNPPYSVSCPPSIHPSAHIPPCGEMYNCSRIHTYNEAFSTEVSLHSRMLCLQASHGKPSLLLSLQCLPFRVLDVPVLRRAQNHA